jgi:hypothetical protein
MSVEVLAAPPSGWPEWVDQDDFEVKDGRDPLGLETITTDRIVPRLVPGVLALSTRARYFSFHLFLLDEFARRGLDPTRDNQSIFLRSCEFEYGAAVLLCPRCESTAAPVGAQSLRGIVRRAKDKGEIARGFSVDSDFGGYGLYYRSPLRDLGLVHQRGTLVGHERLPVDVLAGPRAKRIADAFRSAIEGTTYYRRYFLGDQPIPVAVLREVAEAACLCRLTEAPEEVRLVRGVFFDDVEGLDADDVRRRREAFALRLQLADAEPGVMTDESAFRRSPRRPDRLGLRPGHPADRIADGAKAGPGRRPPQPRRCRSRCPQIAETEAAGDLADRVRVDDAAGDTALHHQVCVARGLAVVVGAGIALIAGSLRAGAA